MPFAIFSDLLGTDEREQLAEKLRSRLSLSQPIQPQLAVFPDMTPDSKLFGFIGGHSYMLFDLPSLSCSWLTLP